MEKQNWILEAALPQTSLGVMHEQRVTVVDSEWTGQLVSQRVTVVDRIAQLERKYSVSLQRQTMTSCTATSCSSHVTLSCHVTRQCCETIYCYTQRRSAYNTTASM